MTSQIEEKQRGNDPNAEDEPEEEDYDQQPPPPADEGDYENGFNDIDEEMLAAMDVDDMALPTPPQISAH